MGSELLHHAAANEPQRHTLHDETGVPEGPFLVGMDNRRTIYAEVKGPDGKSELVLVALVVSAAEQYGIDCTGLASLLGASSCLRDSTAQLAQLAASADHLCDAELRQRLKAIGQGAMASLALARG